MKLFHFYRLEDASGVSGVGPVVEGVEFTNGWCAIRWISEHSSVCFYQSLTDVKAIHGHGGKTEIVIHDFEPVKRGISKRSEKNFELLIGIIEEAARITHFADEGDSGIPGCRNAIAQMRVLLDELEKNIR